MKLPLLLFAFLTASVVQNSFCQTAEITFQTNGRPVSSEQNPFRRFVGEWTLKQDTWIQNWGATTDTIQLPFHHTVCAEINTDNSLLAIVDGPQPNGHIFWSYNPATKEVSHLSSFGTSRAGAGTGSVNANGDVQLKLSFADEAEGTYRVYNYTWIDVDTYHMKSVQHAEDDQPTGLFYEGTFVRVKSSESTKKQAVLAHGKALREAFAAGDLAQIGRLHHPEVSKALGYHNVLTGRKEVMKNLQETLASYTLEFIENEVEDLLIQDQLAIEQTRFAIRGTPKRAGTPFVFKGRTMVTYIESADSPTGWVTLREIIQPED